MGRRLEREPRDERVSVSIGPHPGRIKVQLPAPHQAGSLTEIGDLLEEALEHLDPEPLADAGQARVIGQLLIQRVAEVPAVRQVQASGCDELAFGADALEELHQL